MSFRSILREFAVYVRASAWGDVPVATVVVVAAEDADAACQRVEGMLGEMLLSSDVPWSFREALCPGLRPLESAMADVAHEVLSGTMMALRGCVPALADGTPLVPITRTSRSLREWHARSYDNAMAPGERSGLVAWPGC